MTGPEPSPRTGRDEPGVLVVDGMAFRFGGWSEDLGRSGIDTIIVTVDDFVSGFEPTLRRMTAVREAVDQDARMTLVLDVGDIARARREGAVGIVLAFQNANPIEDRVANLERFHALGLRSMQLTYNHTNLVGSGCLADRDEGLTPFGRDVLRAMNELGILVDLSHCGSRTAIEAIEASAAPPVFTHAGARAVTPNPRNRTDDEIRAVAAAGGLIGLSPYGPFCWDPAAGRRPTLGSLLRHVDHVVGLVGDEHVGFGGDWPVGLSTEDHVEAMHVLARDAAAVIGDYNARVGESAHLRYPSDMPSLAEASRLPAALSAAGYGPASVRRMAGENFMRVFTAVWR